MPVVVVGSVNVDLTVVADRLPKRGETVLGLRLSRSLGGKGANQALAAHAAGQHTVLVAAAGDDSEGAWALGTLRAAGVDVSWLRRAGKTPTGTALIAVEEASGDNQIVVAPGANSALTAQDVEAALASVAAEHGSPVVLVSFEIPSPAVDAACMLATSNGWPLVVNPAPARPLRPATYGPSTVLTPNLHEARELIGADFGIDDDETDAPAQVRELLDAGLRGVAVTVGSRGALLYDASGAHLCPAPPVGAVNTTGAGDVFNGTVAAAIADGVPLSAAVREGVRAASQAVAALMPRVHHSAPPAKEMQIT
ncbi:MAG TPA: ribokinase [Trebonia sp.]|jgi:ribokinase|nr:ribokinase [Trebonia sp.]